MRSKSKQSPLPAGKRGRAGAKKSARKRDRKLDPVERAILRQIMQ